MFVKLFTQLAILAVWLRWLSRPTNKQLRRLLVIGIVVTAVIVLLLSPPLRQKVTLRLGLIMQLIESMAMQLIAVVTANTLRFILWTFIAFIFIVVAGYVFRWHWTGLASYTYTKKEGEEIYQGKRLWDWLQLLIIPAVLASGALLFNYQNARTQQEVTNDNQQEATLQKYFDDMSDLMLNKHLLTSRYGDEVRSVASARTVSSLRRVDTERKNLMLQFLSTSKLTTIVSFEGADLSNTSGPVMDFSYNNLGLANLSGANMGFDQLTGTLLIASDLTNANLVLANLTQAKMYRSNLKNAKLNGAILNDADLSVSNLSGANLTAAKLIGANLRGATLKNTNFTRADLSNADLRNILFEEVTLTDIIYNEHTKWPDGFTPPSSRRP